MKSMKSLQDFKSIIIEEEKQDYTKFDTLVRAGLANKSQIQRLHKILDKMGEERPVFSPQDRQIMQGLFNKMVELITGNKQIFQQTRRAVNEEEDLEEGVVATSDYKISKTGRKYRAHHIHFGTGEDSKTTEDDEDQFNKIGQVKESVTDIPLKSDPPFTLVLKRKAIRLYPNDTKIALYYSDRLKTYFSVPYSNIEGQVQGPIMAREQTESSLSEQIKEGIIYHKNGTQSEINEQTGDLLINVYNSLNENNKQKFESLIVSNINGLHKAIEFCTK